MLDFPNLNMPNQPEPRITTTSENVITPRARVQARRPETAEQRAVRVLRQNNERRQMINRELRTGLSFGGVRPPRFNGLGRELEPIEPMPTPIIKSEDNGQYIKATRTFGVEYEINFSWNDANALRELIGEGYKIVPDGSVRRGLEIVSPILGGSLGEKEVTKVCKAINDLGGGVDETCGLHLHFGAKDFYKKDNVEVWTLEHALKYSKENGDKRYFFVLHNTALEELNRVNPQVTEMILKKKPIPFFEWELIAPTLEDMPTLPMLQLGSKWCTFPNFNIKTNFTKRNDKAGKIRRVSADKFAEYKGHIAYSEDTHAFLVPPEANKNLRVIVMKRGKDDQKSLERLKRLAAFYVVFDDIIMSMLPQDRRENDYTRRTGHRMSIEDILSARTVTEFMKGWFKFTENSQVTHARGNGGNGAVRGRYCGLNLYSLFNIGTVEIRYLGGTIDPQRILFWANLHQTIIDLAADTNNHRLSVKSINKAALILDTEKRRDLFFKKLQLPHETERYWRDEIENHRNDDTVIFEECLEEDAAWPKKEAVTEQDLDRALLDLQEEII